MRVHRVAEVDGRGTRRGACIGIARHQHGLDITLGRVTPGRVVQVRTCPVGQFHRQRRRRATVGDQQPRADHRRVVAGDVGDQQVQRGATAQPTAQAPALDARERLAHAVHGADVVATGEQPVGETLQPREVAALRQQFDQARRTARAEHQETGIGGRGVEVIDQGPPRGEALLARDRVIALEVGDACDPVEFGLAMAVLADHQAADHLVAKGIERTERHRGGRLAHRDEVQWARRRVRCEVAPHRAAPLHRGQRGMEDREQVAAVVHARAQAAGSSSRAISSAISSACS